MAISSDTNTASRVGQFRFAFTNTHKPYVLIQATRPSVIGSSDPSNITLPSGTLSIDPVAREITGSNPERQDSIIQPLSTPALGFSGYFCARFDMPFVSWGTAYNGTLSAGRAEGNGSMLSGYVTFASSENLIVNVRIGVSFISVEQARKNLDTEIPDGVTLEDTAAFTRESWAEKLNRIQIDGASDDELETFYTAFFHTLQVMPYFICRSVNLMNSHTQYPSEQSEDGMYYSGYDQAVHHGPSYTGYSIWVCQTLVDHLPRIDGCLRIPTAQNGHG